MKTNGYIIYVLSGVALVYNRLSGAYIIRFKNRTC